MKLIDAVECAKLCLAHASKAEDFLVIASPAYDFGGFNFAERINAKNVLMIYRQNDKGGPDFSGRKFDALKAQAELMERKGISVKLNGRENLSAKCMVSEKCAVLGSLAFENPECFRWEFDDDDRDIEHVNFNPAGIFRERFEMGLIAYPNAGSADELKTYRESCLLLSSMFCVDSMDKWEKYKRIASKAGGIEEACRYLESWADEWNGVENALFADDSEN